MNEEYKKEIMKRWDILEGKLKNTNDPQKIQELKIAIGQCKLALSHYGMSSKIRKSKSPVTNQTSIKRK